MTPIRKDPAGFKTIELNNARILVGLVNDFEGLVIFLLKGRGRQLAQPNAAPPISSYTSARELFKQVDSIEKFMDGNPSTKAAATVSEASVQHGKAWADKNLGRFGVSTGTPSQSNAKPFTLPVEQRMVDMYKERVQSEIKGLTSYQSTNIKRAITEGLQKGETVNQITKRVSAVTPMAQSKAITIARTETLAAGNAATTERYKSAGIDMVEWVAAYDDRVCPECEEKHGNVYPIDEAPQLPIHPNCRCTTVPVITRD